MGCSACSQRKTSRIVPITPTKQGAERKVVNPNSAISQGSALRNKLRYSGR